jgi:hypothetical protein
MDKPGTLQPFTVEVSVAELPESIVSRFSTKIPATARVAVTIEPAEDEEDRLASLRRDLQIGVDDFDVGRAAEARDVFPRLKERFGAG